MPYKYFDGPKVKLVPDSEYNPSQSENPFAPGYVKPKHKYYYPPEYFKMRPIIIKKFNDRCLLCGELGYEVHHIDYNKMNCAESNFALLCKLCHSKTNTNREYWQVLISDKVSEYDRRMNAL